MISVILPTYNRSQLLLRAVDSVLKQTYADIELIVVDDGSTDDTQAKLEQIRDPRLHCLRQKGNKGACAARNMGIAFAKGEYIAFQDSDDIWCADKLACQLSFLEETKADIVFCAFERWEGESERGQRFPHANVLGGQIFYEQLLVENLISTQTILGKRSCFSTHLFDVSFPRLQDWELVLRLSKCYRIFYNTTVMAKVYIQKDSISQNHLAGLEATVKIHEQHKDAIDVYAPAAKQFAISTAMLMISCGQNPWKVYWRAMSPRFDFEINLFFLKHSMHTLIFKR